ncbi:ephrin-A2 [Erinaceus europaeus]|uniref:Ephrin-A2 n=1 Tax=Erinaceus europaeus TaxID=9365 RepID=A0ABM3WLM5_ERIEU|nr:ephrin-A2 [Erinaceus europaeus]
MAPPPGPLLPLLLLLLRPLPPPPARAQDPSRQGDRHTVYWNRSNPRLQAGGRALEVALGDYLDVLCPHYEAPLPPEGRMERPVLLMVGGAGHAACDGRGGLRRWVCDRPAAPGGPLRFSEKFQRYTPFSLGFEFRPGHAYYYISTSPPSSMDRSCLRLTVYVRPTNETLYEAPEPIFTSNNSCGGAWPPHLALSAAPLLWTLLGS